MGKAVADVVLDATLDKIATATLQVVCSAQPTTRAEAVATFALADVAMAGGDFTKADGTTSGRKVTVGAKNAFAVDTSGSGTHVALVDATQLLYVTTMTTQALTSGNTASTNAWVVELADPA